MKTEKELQSDILKITMQITDNYPELVKFLKEMPETVPNENNPEMNIKVLLEYYNSLESILEKYTETQI